MLQPNTSAPTYAAPRHGRLVQEPTLNSAKITFHIMEGDRKDAQTPVGVTVTSKDGRLQIARVDAVGEQDVWEVNMDHIYEYALPVSAGIKLSQIEAAGVQTRIDWVPPGDKRHRFEYSLILSFSENDPSKPSIEMVQKNPRLIEISKDIRSYTQS